MKQKTKTGWGVYAGLMAAWFLLAPLDLPAQTAGKAIKRHVIVTMSDGTQHEGIAQLAGGKDFTFTGLGEDADTMQSATLKAGTQKIRTFNLNVVKEMTFSNHTEEYLQKFKMINISFLAAKTGGAKKVRFGVPYPVVRQKCTVLFNSGERMTGVLTTRAMYLTKIDPDTGFHKETIKLIIRSKYTGDPGQSYDDLVRVERIKMLDEGDQFVRDMPIAFRSFDFDSITTNQVRITKWGDTKFSIDEVVDRQAFIEENRRVADEGGEPAEAEPYLVRMCALTQDTLTKVPVRKDADGTVRVYSTIGENVFLAAQVNGKWGAGWPAEGTVRNDLFESVEKHFLKVQDYYNEKKLLGIISKKNGRDILALVRLRRDIPDPEFALAWAQSTAWGPGQANFEMGVDGKLAEFYRLGIWRFTRDVKSGKMTLVDRGTFFRTKIRLENETPEMETRNDLWPVVMKDGRLIVGSN